MFLKTWLGSLGGNSLDDEKSNDTLVPSVPTYFQDDFSGLIESFQQFKPSKKTNKANGTAKGKTAEELAAEAAAAKKKIDKTLRPNFAAFDEEHQVGLVGIFEEEGIFAVLQVINYETKQIEYRQLRENDVLNGYKLVSVQENSVKLNNGKRELSLILFKRLNG
jgi:hypothetical protein